MALINTMNILAFTLVHTLLAYVSSWDIETAVRWPDKKSELYEFAKRDDAVERTRRVIKQLRVDNVESTSDLSLNRLSMASVVLFAAGEKGVADLEHLLSQYSIFQWGSANSAASHFYRELTAKEIDRIVEPSPYGKFLTNYALISHSFHNLSAKSGTTILEHIRRRTPSNQLNANKSATYLLAYLPGDKSWFERWVSSDDKNQRLCFWKVCLTGDRSPSIKYLELGVKDPSEEVRWRAVRSARVFKVNLTKRCLDSLMIDKSELVRKELRAYWSAMN